VAPMEEDDWLAHFEPQEGLEWRVDEAVEF
jgi:hypothetical protein